MEDEDVANVVLEAADRSGRTVRFADLWSASPVALIFLRRFGCKICRVHAQDLDSIRDDIAALGASLICISHEFFGEASDKDRSWEAGGFFHGPVWVDKDKVLYSRLFKRKTIWSAFGLLDMSHARLRQASERGVTGTILTGDGFQLGGTFVVDMDGSVKLDNRQAFYGDDATNEEIVAAVKKCARVAASLAGGASGATAGPDFGGASSVSIANA